MVTGYEYKVVELREGAACGAWMQIRGVVDYVV